MPFSQEQADFLSALVTGGAGLVGYAVVGHLLMDGWHVTALGRRPRPGNLPPECAYVQADLVEAVPELGHFDLVVHAAATLGDGSLSLNIAATKNALEMALKVGADKFIFFSSLPVIGRPERSPINEDHPVRPATEYHISKYAGELLTTLPCYGGLKPTILRLGSPLGPGEAKGRFIPSLLKACRDGRPIRLLGRGERAQNYVDVRDVARAVALAVGKPEAQGLFLIPGHAASNLEVACLCLNVSGACSEIVMEGEDLEEGDCWLVDGAKAASVLGYEPLIPLGDSLRQLWEAMP